MAPVHDEVDRLLAELHAHGITFLTGTLDAVPSSDDVEHSLPPTELLHRLAASREPSVRDATVALLLLHPKIAIHLPPITLPEGDADEQIAVLALAAAYLQRQWRARLRLALGEKPILQVDYWREWHLPEPDWAPEEGLRALAVRERTRTGKPLNYLAAWQQQVDHLTNQCWRARRGERPRAEAPARTSPAGAHRMSRFHEGSFGMRHAPRGGTPMSMRAPADRERIERFLVRLGALAHQPGRIYLVGGTTMVYEGFRATTVDVDLLVEADDPTPIVTAIRGLKDALDINVEFASPRDFIPLPTGWRERSIYVGRYGALDVFHFDLYSVALSKIERGTERDFQDVVALVRGGRIDPAELDATFHEILPRIATEGMAGMDPMVFEEHYRYLRTLLAP